MFFNKKKKIMIISSNIAKHIKVVISVKVIAIKFSLSSPAVLMRFIAS